MHAQTPGPLRKPGLGRAPTPRRFLYCQASQDLAVHQTHETVVYLSAAAGST